MAKSLVSLRVIILLLFITACGDSREVLEVTLIPVKQDDKFEFINNKGESKISPQFSEASIFYDGLALVKSTGNEARWGYVNTDGDVKINYSYLSATVFNDGLAWVVKENGPPEVINAKGDLVFTMQDAHRAKMFKGGIAPFSVLGNEGEKWGFVGKDGTVKIPNEFSDAGYFSEGRCPVKNNEGKWGYIDEKGIIVIKYDYNDAKDFIDGRAIVKSGDKYGVIDKDGKFVVNPKYIEIIDDEGIFLVKTEKYWGWCDDKGEEFIDPQFADAYPFRGKKLTPAKQGKNYGYIDNKGGKFILQPDYEQAYPFNGDLALYSSDGKWGFINTEGKNEINPRYKEISKDYLKYIREGLPFYDEVTTDYFNISSIIDKIKLEIDDANQGGTPWASTNEKVLAQFKKNLEMFSFGYSSQLLSIYENEKISNVGFISKKYFCIPYVTKLDTLDDGQVVEDMVLNNDGNTGNGFLFALTLSGKGTNKSKQVFTEISNHLSQNIKSVKKSEQSTEELIVYSDDRRLIAISMEGATIKLLTGNIQNGEFDFENVKNFLQY